MDEDIEGLDELMLNLDKIKFGRKEKAAIVEAGAVLVEKKVTEDTKAKMNPELTKIVMDFKKSHGGRYEYQGHLYKGVTHKKNEFLDGSTNIGFQKGYVTVAHWLNDGTYQQPATYFLNRSFHGIEEDSNGEIEKAQAEMATAILHTKGLVN